MIEKIKNYFNPSSIFLESSYNYPFSHFLGILGLKNYPTDIHSEGGKINKTLTAFTPFYSIC